jgi:hypothetical protein
MVLREFVIHFLCNEVSYFLNYNANTNLVMEYSFI